MFTVLGISIMWFCIKGLFEWNEDPEYKYFLDRF